MSFPRISYLSAQPCLSMPTPQTTQRRSRHHTRITGGNFRLIERLMSQVARVLEINQLDIITPDVVNAAKQTLVVGPQ